MAPAAATAAASAAAIAAAAAAAGPPGTAATVAAAAAAAAATAAGKIKAAACLQDVGPAGAALHPQDHLRLSQRQLLGRLCRRLHPLSSHARLGSICGRGGWDGAAERWDVHSAHAVQAAGQWCAQAARGGGAALSRATLARPAPAAASLPAAPALDGRLPRKRCLPPLPPCLLAPRRPAAVPTGCLHPTGLQAKTLGTRQQRLTDDGLAVGLGGRAEQHRAARHQQVGNDLGRLEGGGQQRRGPAVGRRARARAAAGGRRRRRAGGRGQPRGRRQPRRRVCCTTGWRHGRGGAGAGLPQREWSGPVRSPAHYAAAYCCAPAAATQGAPGPGPGCSPITHGRRLPFCLRASNRSWRAAELRGGGKLPPSTPCRECANEQPLVQRESRSPCADRKQSRSRHCGRGWVALVQPLTLRQPSGGGTPAQRCSCRGSTRGPLAYCSTPPCSSSLA